jgi:hypothetical protein
VRGLGGEASLCRNEVSSLAHWFLRGTKERRTTHSHVFHLYSSGGNGAASDAASCWRAPVKPFLLLRSRPLGPPWPAEADLNASYVFRRHPRCALSFRADSRRALVARRATGFSSLRDWKVTCPDARVRRGYIGEIAESPLACRNSPASGWRKSAKGSQREGCRSRARYRASIGTSSIALITAQFADSSPIPIIRYYLLYLDETLVIPSRCLRVRPHSPV